MSVSTRALSVCASVLLLALLVGCDALADLGGNEPAPNEPYDLTVADSTTVGPSVKITLRSPDTVALGDAFEAQTRLHNQSGTTVNVVTGTPALYDFGVYDGPERVPLKGTVTYRPQVQTEHDLPPVERTREFQIQAERISDAEEPIGPGPHTAQLALKWRVDGTLIQDTLDTTIVFREE